MGTGKGMDASERGQHVRHYDWRSKAGMASMPLLAWGRHGEPCHYWHETGTDGRHTCHYQDGACTQGWRG